MVVRTSALHAGEVLARLILDRRCSNIAIRRRQMMTKVAILPVPTEGGGISYRALAEDKQSQGKTAGEALDALTLKLSNDKAGTLIIVQSQRPDVFFDAAQQQRMAELMKHWRSARDRGETLPDEEQAELEALVEAELRASAYRTDALANDLQI